MLIRKSPAIRPSEITPPDRFFDRRRFIGATAAAGAALLASARPRADDAEVQFRRLTVDRGSPYSTDAEPTPLEDVISYNNFYEFGFDKRDPARRAAALTTRPWSVTVDGEAKTTGTFDLEDILKPHAVEERVYRFRCVEAWSMVVPWNGIPLADVLRRFEPTSRAKYVAFETVYRPDEMIGQRRGLLDFPYVEGLTIAEAMHPLTLLAVGVYGLELPNQNGAPLRLVVPWKYGFKSIKSIVRISFTERQPPTTWSRTAPNEYGFYANVNPEVDHPRWSQASERLIGAGFFGKRQPTRMFNGYADEVADLYAGLDLGRYF